MRAVALLLGAAAASADGVTDADGGDEATGAKGGVIPDVPNYAPLRTAAPLPFEKVNHQKHRQNALDAYGNHDDVTERHIALKAARQLIVQEKARTLELAKAKEHNRFHRIEEDYKVIIGPYKEKVKKAGENAKGPAELTAHNKKHAAYEEYTQAVKTVKDKYAGVAQKDAAESRHALDALHASYEEKMKTCREAAQSSARAAGVQLETAAEEEIKAAARGAAGESPLPLLVLAAVASAAFVAVRRITSAPEVADVPVASGYGTADAA